MLTVAHGFRGLSPRSSGIRCLGSEVRQDITVIGVYDMRRLLMSE